MSSNTIQLIMEGTDNQEGHVELSLFLKELGIVRSAINCIDKQIYGANEASLKLLITDLSHSSPATTTITPIHDTDGRDFSEDVISEFTKIIDYVVQGSIPLNANYKALESLKGIGVHIGKKLKYATLVVNQKAFDITPSLSRTIENALERGESCVGSVEGALEQINIHGREKHFTIYPDIGPTKVRCIFPENLHNTAVNSIEKKVEVSGVLKFRPGAPFPHEILAQGITVQPEDANLPTFVDLLGIAPIEDTRASEDIVREDRDGWH